MNVEIFAKRFKKARIEKGYSQKQLGMRVGLSDKSISMYEKGIVYPPISNLLKLAKELDKDISYFLSD
jgi:transcriptional regulator with XRE-family HTH domain